MPRHTQDGRFYDSAIRPAAGLHPHGHEHTLLFAAFRESSGEPKTQLSIGRSPSKCDIVLKNDRYVSQRHAVITWDHAQKAWIIQNSSGNGLFVNGKRTHDATRLVPGMRLRMGYKRLIVVDPSGLVPIEASSVGHFFWEAIQVYGNASAAARRLKEYCNQTILDRSHAWKRRQLYDAGAGHPRSG